MSAPEKDSEKIYDLEIEVFLDGSASLKQSSGCGEVDHILIHQTQLRYLAEQAGLIPEDDSGLRVKELENTLRLLGALLMADDVPDYLRAAAQSVLGAVGIVPVTQEEIRLDA